MKRLTMIFCVVSAFILSPIVVSPIMASAAPASSVQHTDIEYSARQKRDLGFEIARELRCPVSTNSSLLDSEARVAHELKGQIFLMLDEGKTKAEIIDFLVERFGEKIRYSPSLTVGTSVLWLGPIGLLLFTFIMLALYSLSGAKRRSQLNKIGTDHE